MPGRSCPSRLTVAPAGLVSNFTSTILASADGGAAAALASGWPALGSAAALESAGLAALESAAALESVGLAALESAALAAALESAGLALASATAAFPAGTAPGPRKKYQPAPPAPATRMTATTHRMAFERGGGD